MNFAPNYFYHLLFSKPCYCRFFPLHHPPIPSTAQKSSYNPEVDKNKMMLLDAELDLNEALLAGVRASLDTLGYTVKMNHAAKDTAEKLKVMKREREQKEMRTYLEYMRDSLTKDCNNIIGEKQEVQGRLNSELAIKAPKM